MQVFKFGGASIKDAGSIKNVAKILESNTQQKIIVVSAMGKTTNALEEVVSMYHNNNQNYIEYLHQIREYHQCIADNLFKKEDVIFHKIHALFDTVEYFLAQTRSTNYTFIYDQVIPVGELVSSTILSSYMQKVGIDNTWLDAREVIRTDHSYTDASVLWKETISLIKKYFKNNAASCTLTQGFIASTSEQLSTTLGREGSDYTAAIFSYCLNVECMKIWKDVAGVMNADPKIFKDAVLIPRITYKEAIEMTYYGAKVIHPKTIRPLQNKKIPLEVRSFIEPQNAGTQIHNFKEAISYPPIIVKKTDQQFLKISSKDFSFITEHHMQEIFGAFSKMRLRVNLMQNKAISFSVCVDDKKDKITALNTLLKEQFTIKYQKNIELLTIRHYTQKVVDSELKNQEVLLSQKTKDTLQVLFKK